METVCGGGAIEPNQLGPSWQVLNSAPGKSRPGSNDN